MTQLSPSRRGTRSVLKITRKHVDDALENIGGRRVRDDDVHAARKALKKARAALRLLRPGLPRAAYRQHNDALRDAARPLSEVRDARVLGDTVDKLVERYGAPARALRLAGLRRTITRHRTAARRRLLHTPTALPHSRRLLRQARARLKAVDGADGGWSILGAGLEHVYAQGRRALARARSRPTPENFHELRKQVKYLRYQLEILEPLWPGMLDALIDQLHSLSDHLGDDHDLTLLRELAAKQSEALNAKTRAAMGALIARYQGELRRKSVRLAARIFEERPQLFAKRFGQYWRDFRAD